MAHGGDIPEVKYECRYIDIKWGEGCQSLGPRVTYSEICRWRDGAKTWREHVCTHPHLSNPCKKIIGGGGLLIKRPGMLIFPGQISVSSVKRGRMLQLDQLNCQHQTTELVKRLIRDLRGLSSNPGYMLSSTIFPFFILAQNFEISVIL